MWWFIAGLLCGLIISLVFAFAFKKTAKGILEVNDIKREYRIYLNTWEVRDPKSRYARLKIEHIVDDNDSRTKDVL